MLQKALIYLEGLGLTYVAMVLISAVGWINVADVFPGSRFVIPLAAAVILWTAMYVLSIVAWAFLLIVAAYTLGLGFILAPIAIGWVGQHLIAYLLPTGWVSFPEGYLASFGVGVTVFLIDMVVDEKVRKGLANAAK